MSRVVQKIGKTLRSREDREEARFDLRFMFASLFANIIGERRVSGETLATLAADIGVDKGQLSNWLATEPNWQISSIADISSGLRLKLRIYAMDEYGRCWSPSGLTTPEATKQISMTASNYTTMHVVRFNIGSQKSASRIRFKQDSQPAQFPLNQTTSSIINMPTKSLEVVR